MARAVLLVFAALALGAALDDDAKGRRDSARRLEDTPMPTAASDTCPDGQVMPQENMPCPAGFEAPRSLLGCTKAAACFGFPSIAAVQEQCETDACTADPEFLGPGWGRCTVLENEGNRVMYGTNDAVGEYSTHSGERTVCAPVGYDCKGVPTSVPTAMAACLRCVNWECEGNEAHSEICSDCFGGDCDECGDAVGESERQSFVRGGCDFDDGSEVGSWFRDEVHICHFGHVPFIERLVEGF